VAWRTPVTRNADCPTPVGFGVEIIDATKSSMAAWKEGYRSLQAKLEIDPASVPRPDLRAASPESKPGPEMDRPTIRVKRGANSLQTLRVDMVKAQLPLIDLSDVSLDPARQPTMRLEMDPASLPTVRPPHGQRARSIVWSSMNSGPSATYLPSETMPLQKPAEITSINARPS
jgi:hypothetical protein